MTDLENIYIYAWQIISRSPYNALLGIFKDENLNFTQYVNHICSKASKLVRILDLKNCRKIEKYSRYLHICLLQAQSDTTKIKTRISCVRWPCSLKIEHGCPERNACSWWLNVHFDLDPTEKPFTSPINVFFRIWHNKYFQD